IRVGAGELPPLDELQSKLQPCGHAIQMRVYAEDPGKNFQPSAGLLSAVLFPQADGCELRIDHWIETGLEVSPYFDPMLAKVISWAPTREAAVDRLDAALATTQLYGIETNIDYGRAIL